MNPGATISPRASNFSSAAPRILLGAATSATRPSRNRTSMGASMLAAGSIKWPPLITRLRFSLRWVTLTGSSQSLCQNRHAYRHSVANFFDDHRLRAIGHIPGQFEASNNRAGMHQQGIAPGQLQPRHRHLVTADVILQTDFCPRQPLFL